MYPVKYEVVDSSEEDVFEYDNAKSSHPAHEVLDSPRRKRFAITRQKILMWLNGLIFCISLYLFFITAVLIRNRDKDSNDLLKKTSEHCT